MSRDAVAAPPRPTPLHALHQALDARLVTFAGYALPVQYAGGIKHEHLHTRASAGLFDVSHMGQIAIAADAAALETVVPGEIEALGAWRQRYSVLTNDAGGIIDDLMVTRLPDSFFVVVNAAFKSAVLAHLRARLGAERVTLLEERALLALQGPAAAAVLDALGVATASLPFMAARECDIAGVHCLVNRCGYTGEDGFEIALAAGDAAMLARRLLEDARVEPIGLGARDSLRLEAGLCLSGTDIDATTTPAVADLAWVVARKYREGRADARFPGADVVLNELAAGVPRRRVGLRPRGRAPVRGGAVLHDAGGAEVGRITSGGFGPSVEHPIAMGYVDSGLAAPGTVLAVNLRGRTHEVEVTALPFVAHRYFKP